MNAANSHIAVESADLRLAAGGRSSRLSCSRVHGASLAPPQRRRAPLALHASGGEGGCQVLLGHLGELGPRRLLKLPVGEQVEVGVGLQRRRQVLLQLVTLRRGGRCRRGDGLLGCCAGARPASPPCRRATRALPQQHARAWAQVRARARARASSRRCSAVTPC